MDNPKAPLKKDKMKVPLKKDKMVILKIIEVQENKAVKNW